MTTSSAGSRPLVIDASFAVAAVLPVAAAEKARELLIGWHRDGRSILAPSHWLVEAVSALRKLWYLGKLTADEASRAAGDLFALGVDPVDPDPDLCQASLRWAERLTQSTAYDAFYLARADEEGAELWTADGRLSRRAGQHGFDRVRLLEQ
jgi:predicted nucleic acid-binding protein